MYEWYMDKIKVGGLEGGRQGWGGGEHGGVKMETNVLEQQFLKKASNSMYSLTTQYWEPL